MDISDDILDKACEVDTSISRETVLEIIRVSQNVSLVGNVKLISSNPTDALEFGQQLLTDIRSSLLGISNPLHDPEIRCNLVRLNPFDIVVDIKGELDALTDILAAMASPNEYMSDFQVSGLKRTILSQWNNHEKDTLIDHVAETLLKERDERLRDIGFQLKSFTTKGEYGHYFNGKSKLKFSDPLSMIELEHLRQRKNLDQVVLLLVVRQFMHELRVRKLNVPDNR